MRHARMTRQKLRPLVALLAATLMLGACSVAGTSPAAEDRASDALPGASGTGATPPSSEPSSGARASGYPVASADRQITATDVEQLLPNQIGGQPVTKGSMAGNLFLASGLSTPDLQRVLIELGIRPSDISVSFAYTPPGPGRAVVVVFQVRGASERDRLRALNDGRQPETRGSTAGKPTVLGGKPTVTIADETVVGGNAVYRYVAGSFVFFVTAGHESTAGEILASLP